MRQRLIQYYRMIARDEGFDDIDATNRAVDQADTDLREMRPEEVRRYVQQLPLREA